MKQATSGEYTRSGVHRVKLGLSLLAWTVTSCSSKASPAGPSTSAEPGGSTPISLAASNAPTLRPERDDGLFPIDHTATSPDAVRLCEALHAVPAARLRECCGGTGSPEAHLVAECTRVLSYGVAHDGLAMASSDVDACVKAITDETAGCDWIFSTSAPVPLACDHIAKGSLAAGAKCRSSLECQEGLQCNGLTETAPGECGPAKTGHARCDLGADAMATLTRQADLPSRDPACPGGVSLPREGEPCKEGACAPGSKCLHEVCTQPKSEGSACTSDLECRGKCQRNEGAHGGACKKTCPNR